MSAKSKKRIMRDFQLNEISAVTYPAQKGAKMVIMKRDDTAQAATIRPADEGKANAIVGLPLWQGAEKALEGKTDFSKLSPDAIGEMILKGQCSLTTPMLGHSHLVEVGLYDRERGGGFTSSCSTGCDYHSHPFVIGADGAITIGMAMGHTHEVMSVEAVKALAAPTTETTEKGDDMDAKQIAELQALAGMTDAQKAHYGKLGGDAKEAFAKADNAGRASLIAAAAGSDPVIYTAKNGAEYRKSDDPRLVQMAKDNDAMLAATEIEKAARLEVEALNLAKSWTHMPGTIEEKTAKAKDLLAAPAAARAAALEAIEAHKAAVAPLFTAFGARDGQPTIKSGADDAQEKLDKIVTDLAAQHNLSKPDALVKALGTAEGSRLYSKINPRLSAGAVH
jgi:hypothetical protein